MQEYTLAQVFGKKAFEAQKKRFYSLAAGFEKTFGEKPSRYFSASGRTEICGNHTDHNNGCVLAAGVSLDCIAAVQKTEDGRITFASQGYETVVIDTGDLEARQSEQGTSAALIRGVCAGFAQRGLNVGGFRAYCMSDVLSGSGLSSSAAFEVLVGDILAGLYNACEPDDIEIAKISQYAENVYFGKPSGLMDQMACSVGGFISIDFKDPNDPVVTPLKADIASHGYALFIVDTKGDHADLTPDYAAIPAEMKAVAGVFGKSVLRELSRDELIGNCAEVRRKCGDRAYLRALHFFDENERVRTMTKALGDGDIGKFLDTVSESGMSSMCWLQNIFPCSQPQNQGLSAALYAAKRVLSGKGACRVHGGGFAGTIQAFVPYELSDSFISEMQRLFGEGCCYELDIRNVGGAEIILSED